ncbi:hypothetical protein [Liquorilactobacillus satsumensis]|uniref:hypothetical protein n=1 Tax=Liquorilactobacillus satsumensis TaxID=259059 RepID=UPI001E29AC7B|nr:hypothetical protein [Liquorilactobacillus satsumensis]MCC7667090.1 hypothetical protein [Liquorilactobacillus satsumensis]MCP9311697.1 hypothetical protein [Liquorilactobacillus satsumensis]MCP9358252.1 hypothetical protein [Liquorilactobacillus satsumensis]MCP9358830.1 hypothetical protein [Liquorilactobacillus satsumensis]MCP9372206.1 hypothetical protein [Liquorilactobacillus satsumensis]
MGKKFLNIFKIHSERYAELIKQAEFDDEAVINAHTTLLVMDCQSFPELNCKSFLLDQYRGIIKTNKETRKLINQFVAQRPLSFWGMRIFSACTAHQGALSYVFGNTILIPLTGATQHSTHWLMLNKVKSSSFNHERRTMNVWFSTLEQKLLHVEIAVKKAVVHQHIVQAMKTHITQRRLLDALMRDFNVSEAAGQLQYLAEHFDEETDYVTLKNYTAAWKEEIVTATLKEILGAEVTPALTQQYLRALRKKWERL